VVLQLVSSVDVGDVHLDDGSCKHLEGVIDIAIEVKEYPAGLMMMVCAFVRADGSFQLERPHDLIVRKSRTHQGRRQLLATFVYGGERRRAVDVRLAHAQQVEI